MYHIHFRQLSLITLISMFVLLPVSRLTAQTPDLPRTEETHEGEVSETGEPQNVEPAETAPTPTEEKSETEHSESVWTFLKKGGATMIILAVISTFIAALSLERYFFFRRQKISTRGYYDRVSAALESGGLDELEKVLKNDDLLLSRVIRAGLKYRSEGIDRVEKTIETVASVEIGKLEQSLNFLNNLGNLAPLVGFFGTVTGMRHSFLQFVEKAAPTARDLAGGVEEALITTITGLIIAIPAYFIYNIFIYYIDALTIELERCTSDILEKMK